LVISNTIGIDHLLRLWGGGDEIESKEI